MPTVSKVLIIFCMTLSVVGDVWAQTEQDDIDAILGLEPSTPSRSPGPSAQPTPTAAPALGVTNAPETYVVRYGDTLWDLCARFLNNPWYWPKIWSYNGGLDNPHWIRPGTVLKFYPQSDEAPIVVQSVPSDEFTSEGGDPNGSQGTFDQTASSFDGPNTPSGEFDMGAFEMQDTAEPVLGFEALPLFESGAGIDERLQRIPSANVTKRRVTVFVEDEIPVQAGELKNAVTNSSFLSSADTVYLDLKTDVTLGDVFQIYRHRQDIEHPISGGKMGSIVEVVGEVVVQGQARGMHVGTISQVFQPALRGDKVGPIADMSIREIRPQSNSLALRGYVMGAAEDPRFNLGQHDLVFIDKGNKDGVQVGNTFYVMRGEDQMSGSNYRIPDEIVAQVMIIDVRNSVSTAILLFSNRSIAAGDRVEMRPSGS